MWLQFISKGSIDKMETFILNENRIFSNMVCSESKLFSQQYGHDMVFLYV